MHRHTPSPPIHTHSLFLGLMPAPLTRCSAVCARPAACLPVSFQHPHHPHQGINIIPTVIQLNGKTRYKTSVNGDVVEADSDLPGGNGGAGEGLGEGEGWGVGGVCVYVCVCVGGCLDRR